MPRRTLEQRLATLESQFREMKDELSGSRVAQPAGWRHAIEKYADDADLQSVFSEALKLREADRKKGRARKMPKLGRPS